MSFFGSSVSIRSFTRIGKCIAIHDKVHTKDAVSDAQVMFHYASGGFVGASQASFGDLFATLAEVHGSLLASGGAVFGSLQGTEVKMDGLQGKYRVRVDRDGLSVISHSQKRILVGENSNKLHGSWQAESPFTVSGDRASLILKANEGKGQAVLSYDQTVDLSVKDKKVLSAAESGGTLHGQWIASDIITVSDKRFKRNIRSLRGGDQVSSADRGIHADSQEGPSWLLRQLRPVSFRFRSDLDGSHTEAAHRRGEEDQTPERYGFLADELQRVMPALVRTVQYKGDTPIKAVVYQDFIALLVAALQVQQVQMQQLVKRVEILELGAHPHGSTRRR